MARIKKIIIVDDHQLFRQGVISAISHIDFVEVIGQVSSGFELMDVLTNCTPDIVLMDIKMPDMDGVTVTQQVLDKYPKIKIVALSMFDDEVYLENMISAGASGFILKNTNADDLEYALKVLVQDKPYYSEELLSYFTKKYVPKNNQKEEPKLSKRELQVLSLIAKGLTSTEIAKQLFISENTVANHRANLISKTGSKNTITLLAHAIKRNLVEV